MNAPLATQALPAAERRTVPAAMLAALQARFGDRCSTAAAIREQHGRDESPFPVTPPDAVVFCESTDDVAAVVRLADEHAVPVIAFGIGWPTRGSGCWSGPTTASAIALARSPVHLVTPLQRPRTPPGLGWEARGSKLRFGAPPNGSNTVEAGTRSPPRFGNGSKDG